MLVIENHHNLRSVVGVAVRNYSDSVLSYRDSTITIIDEIKVRFAVFLAFLGKVDVGFLFSSASGVQKHRIFDFISQLSQHVFVLATKDPHFIHLTMGYVNFLACLRAVCESSVSQCTVESGPSGRRLHAANFNCNVYVPTIMAKHPTKTYMTMHVSSYIRRRKPGRSLGHK